jgi:hypothetical protein
MGGGTIGLVVSGYVETTSRLGTTETVVTDPCGRIRWKVPSTTTFPLAVTFGDDLIVEDQSANAAQVEISLRRISATGTLEAGPVESEPVAEGVVGADDTLYLVSCPASGPILIARDASLAPLWTLPLGAGGCPDEYVLGPGGVFYFVRQGSASANLTAVQTTSPGPAIGLWSRWNHNAEGNRWLYQ